MSEWIDITRPLETRMMVWPGRKPPRLTWEKRISSGHHCNLSSWEISSHSGTHLDAPLHFIEGGRTVDQISPEVLMGECRVIAIGFPDEEPLGPESFDDCLTERRVLIRTSHSEPSPGKHYRPHKGLLTPAAARLLVDHDVQLIGTDRLSVDDSDGKSYAVHRILLEGGVAVLEGLDLRVVECGKYWLCALPLRLVEAEASPVRAFLSYKKPNGF